MRHSGSEGVDTSNPELNMIELVFLVCLKTLPDQCEERSLAYAEINLSSCILQAQPHLAKWAETHPGLVVARWTCQTRERREIKA